MKVLTLTLALLLVSPFAYAEKPTQEDIIGRTLQSVVLISPEFTADHGSGFFISPHEIMTAAHVMTKDTARIQTLDGQSCMGKVKYKEDTADMALLTTTCTGNPVTFSAESQVGQPIYAIGNPQDMEFMVTQGIISSKGYGKILFDATVSEGNSGGVLVNVSGEVLGIVYAKSVLVAIGWAIPSARIQMFMEHVRKYTGG